MNSRTYPELREVVQQAIDADDVVTLERYGNELRDIAMPEAMALADVAHASVLCHHGSYTEALEYFTRALNIFVTLDDRRSIATANGDIGRVYYKLGNLLEAVEYYERSLAMHTQNGDKRSVAGVMCNIGIMYKNIGRHPEALERFHAALSLYEELGNRRGVAISSNGISSVYTNTDNYPEALKYCFRAITELEGLDEKKLLAHVVGNVGIIYYNTANYSAAMEQFQRALAIHEELSDTSGIAISLGNIGNVLNSTGNYLEALENLKRALAMHEGLGNPNGVANVLGNIVVALIELNDVEQATTTMQALDALESRDPLTLTTREVYRARLHVLNGDYTMGVQSLNEAMELAVRYDLRRWQAEIQKHLRDLCQKANDFAGYIEHNNEYTRITEEINGRDTATKLAMQDKQREIDAKDREHQKHMAVLHSTLPKHVADRVARGEVVNDSFDNAAVIFLDIVGFTELSSQLSSQDLIALLDDIFTQCDAICATQGVTKIKTIGDSYMAVAFDDVVNAARAALEMLKIESRIKNQESNQRILQYRIGIHCGPVTAGVIGKERMQYDVWGDTVNVASRMESSGEAGRVHVSEAFALNLEETLVTCHLSLVTSSVPLVTFLRGEIEVKGKGMMNTFWLETNE